LASRDKFDREYRAIIAMLQSHRKAVGMTQWDLARALRIDQSQIPNSNAASVGSTSWTICGSSERLASIRESRCAQSILGEPRGSKRGGKAKRSGVRDGAQAKKTGAERATRMPTAVARLPTWKRNGVHNPPLP
jgi:hypothetical protein